MMFLKRGDKLYPVEKKVTQKGKVNSWRLFKAGIAVLETQRFGKI